jgi:hypothetical protein
MLLFAVAHLLRLRDGTYAVRSTEHPECEGRSVDAWPAREQFRRTLAARAEQLVEKGEEPALYYSPEEVEAIFGRRQASK